MKVNIKTTRLNITDSLRNYVQEKMNMLDKYLGSIPVVNCDVEIGLAAGGKTGGRIYRAEVNLQVPGKILRVVKTEPDMYKAIDKVKDHLRRSIKRYKEIKLDKKRRVIAKEIK